RSLAQAVPRLPLAPRPFRPAPTFTGPVAEDGSIKINAAVRSRSPALPRLLKPSSGTAVTIYPAVWLVAASATISSRETGSLAWRLTIHGVGSAAAAPADLTAPFLMAAAGTFAGWRRFAAASAGIWDRS